MIFEGHALQIRIVQLVFAIIVLGCSASVIHYELNPYYFDDSVGDGSPMLFVGYLLLGNEPRIDFLLFTAIWSILVLFYIIPATTTFHRIHHAVAITILEVLTAIFYFAGFIAVAYTYREGSNYLVFTFSDATSIQLPEPDYFRTADAAAAFGALNWILFPVTAVLSGTSIRASRRTANPAAGVTTTFEQSMTE